MKSLSSYKIHKRKDGRWSSQVMYQRKAYRVYGRTQAEVRKKLADQLLLISKAKMAEISCLSDSKRPLSEWAKHCIETYSKASVRGSTYASYLSILNNHLTTLGNKKLIEINNIMIQNHLLSLTIKGGSERPSPKMLLNIRNFLSLIFRYAIQNHILLYNPVLGVRLPKGSKRVPRALTTDEQAALTTAVRECRRQIMFSVLLAMYTGMRKGEILGLQWRDVDFANKRITVNRQLARQYDITESETSKSVLKTAVPKTDTSVRHIYLFEQLLIDLQNYKDKMLLWKSETRYVHSESDFLFCNSRNEALEPRRYYQYYHELLEMAHIENATFHTLRHTFATRCLEAGIDIVTVSKLLGHSDARLTANTYSHLLEQYQRSEINKIQAFYIPEKQ